MNLRNGRPAVWCLTAAVLFGASTPVSKALLGAIGPFSLAGLLYLGAAGAVVPVALRHGLPEAGQRRKNLLRLGGAVLLGGVLGPVLMLHGLSRAAAASVALWLNLEVVATAVVGWAFFKEHLGGRAWLATALVCAGGALLTGPARSEAGSAAVLLALACACWGVDNNLTALIDGLTPAQSAGVKSLVAGSINLGIGLWLEPGGRSTAAIAGALAMGALGYGVSQVFYIAGAQHLGATRAQVIFSTAPFWGVGLAWGLFREPVLGMQVLAAALMLVALRMMHTERHGHEHAHHAVEHRHWHRHDDGHHEHVHPGLSPAIGHSHGHAHKPAVHDHPHRPDLQHRHVH